MENAMENLQVIEKPINDERGLLDVIKIWPTIQGEGPFQGKPSIFIRLAGCNLQCPGCDTDYTTNRSLVNPVRIVSECQKIMKKCLVVITGGEPFRQNLKPLLRNLFVSGYKVQVETNGTIFQPLPFERIITVCSPKTPIIDEKLVPFIDAYKYILEADHVDPRDGLPTSVLGKEIRPARPHSDLVPIYLQPMDSGNEEQNTKNLTAVVKSCFEYQYVVCIQLHKLLGLE